VNWQPIETAPKGDEMMMKSEHVMLWRPRLGPDIGYYNYQPHNLNPRPYWESVRRTMQVADCRRDAPTHWMPLPEGPAQP